MIDWKLILVVVAILVIGGVLKEAASSRRTGAPPRYKRVDLMNGSEHAFLLALRQAAPPHIIVLAKVRVADLIHPIGRDIAAFNRIAMKHVDFVLYHAQNRQALAAVELDGPIHTSARAQASDKLKNSCFASAQLRLIRVPVADAERSARSLFAALSPGPTEVSPMPTPPMAPTGSPKSASTQRWQRPPPKAAGSNASGARAEHTPATEKSSRMDSPR